MAPQEDQIKALTARDPYGALGLEDDPELAFAGIRALRHMADFCESRRPGSSATHPGGRPSPQVLAGCEWRDRKFGDLFCVVIDIDVRVACQARSDGVDSAVLTD